MLEINNWSGWNETEVEEDVTDSTSTLAVDCEQKPKRFSMPFLKRTTTSHTNRISWDWGDCEDENDEEDDFKKDVKNTVAYSVVCANNRVILFFDVDCYEVQVWIKELRPDLIGKDVPIVVINPEQIILSVNYTAKLLGVKRGEGSQALRDARVLCTRAGVELVEITAGKRYGKVDTFLTLTESNRILKALTNWVADLRKANSNLPIRTPITIERSSRDEFYIDVTELIDAKVKSYMNTCVKKNSSAFIPYKMQIKNLARPKNHPNDKYNGTPTTRIEGRHRHREITSEEFKYRVKQVNTLDIEDSHLDELRLIHGALLANRIIRRIEKDTAYELSAGVGHSKLIAKLACGLNKPKGICVITEDSLPRLGKKIKFQDLSGFGGKIGDAVKNLLSSKLGQNVEYIDDILRAGKDGIDLYNVFKGIGCPDHDTICTDLYDKCQFKDRSRVIAKVHPDTLSTLMTFKGRQQKEVFDEGVLNISKDMQERINYCKKDLGRVAKNLVVKVDMNKSAGNSSRPRDFSIMSLPQETGQFVSHESISEFIFQYIQKNGLEWKNILKVYLTAKNFIDEDGDWF